MNTIMVIITIVAFVGFLGWAIVKADRYEDPRSAEAEEPSHYDQDIFY